MPQFRYIAGTVALGLAVASAAALLDATGRLLARNTFWLLAGTLAVALPAGSSLGLVLARTQVPLRRLGLAVAAGMVVLPLYFHAAAWLAVWGPFGLLALGGPAQRWFPLLGSIWIHGLYGAAWVVLLVYLAARRLDPHLEQQALLWRSPWQALWKVDLPQLRPALAAAAAWVVALTAAEITVTDLLRLRTFAEEFYLWLSLTGGQEQTAEALRRTLPGAVLPVLFAYAAFLLAARFLVGPASGKPALLRPGRGRYAAALGIAAWAFLGLGVPLLALVRQAGVQVTQTAQGWQRSWSAVQAVRTVVQSTWEYRQELGWSALIATTAATLAVVLAMLPAYLARRSRWAAAALGLTAALLLAVPGPWLGWGTLLLFRSPGLPWLQWLYDHSIAAPVVVQAARAAGPVLLVLWVAWAGVPPAVEEQARVLGLGPGRTFARVMLPLRSSYVLGAWLLAWLVAWHELPGTLLVLPPGVDTLPRQLFGLLHARVEDQVAGMCLGLLALALGVAAAVTFPRKPARRIA